MKSLQLGPALVVLFMMAYYRSWCNCRGRFDRNLVLLVAVMSLLGATLTFRVLRALCSP